LILGGDMTGKAVVPSIHQGGKKYRVTLLERTFQRKPSILSADGDLHSPIHVTELIPGSLQLPTNLFSRLASQRQGRRLEHKKECP